MDAAYWHDKWATGEIAFHQSDYHPMMVDHFGTLGLSAGARVFVPLCGKTRDIAWLLGQGLTVAGAELSETAVADLFADLGVVPQITDHDPLRCYQGAGIAIWVGDIFALTASALGAVDAVYDRAALVALPDAMRARYADHLVALTGTAPQFLLTFTYDQSAMAGPPFSVPEAKVRDYYKDRYTIDRIASVPIPPPGLKGRVDAIEEAWLLR